jgi:DNA-binding response OmpR family regulator
MERTAAPLRILVLEDDSSISELLTWILTDAGYEVTSVASLRDARRECFNWKPDVIVADLLLPDGLGSDLVEEMVSKYGRMVPPSIIMSAVPQARRHADAAGAHLCLTKPFDLGELLDAISGLSNSDSRELQPH